jgi:hypothetical protein
VFGYSIALGGLVWYKLGGEKIKAVFAEINTSAVFRNPTVIRIVVFVVVGLLVVGGYKLLVGFPAHLAPKYVEHTTYKLGVARAN